MRVGCCGFTCYQPSSPLSRVGCLSGHLRPEVALVMFLIPVRSFLCYSRKDTWQLCFSAEQRLWIHFPRPLSSGINHRYCYVVVTVEHGPLFQSSRSVKWITLSTTPVNGSEIQGLTTWFWAALAFGGICCDWVYGEWLNGEWLNGRRCNCRNCRNCRCWSNPISWDGFRLTNLQICWIYWKGVNPNVVDFENLFLVIHFRSLFLRIRE